MLTKISSCLLIFFLLASCSNHESNNADNSIADVKLISAINCYSYANAGDTISLKLVYKGESITGVLVYNLKEKDKNTGTIRGAMQGDVLVADYTFMSEGVTSVRQIALKKKENFFIEGWGEINTNNDSVFFRDINSLKFNDNLKLTETDCRE